MIKLRSLLKEGEHIKEIFIWMDHDGKITRVPIEGHAPWQKNIVIVGSMSSLNLERYRFES
jgi:hypothetical protein